MRPFVIATHVLVWILLLVVPYVSTDQIISILMPESDTKYLLLSLAFSSVLLAVFYVNFYLLIPKFLLTRRYGLFALFLFLAVLAAVFFSSLLFVYYDFGQEILANPTIEKILPVVIINVLALWLLSIVSSILFLVYARLKETEKERLSAQIASLKSQINPHFLFNTLNSIYATAFDTSPKAADMVDKLSEMMRYTMKDTQKDFVLLEDEINYINNYVELQKLRLDRSVKLDYRSMDDIPSLQIAPMLLIPFIENAFKYGVNSEQKSWIRIETSADRSAFKMVVSNNKVKVQRDTTESSGLGLENTKHRLELIYPSKHLLVIDDTEKEFSVTLHINLQ